MPKDILIRLFEHNNWANKRLIEACHSLSDDHLDAKHEPISTWSIREALSHLAEAQQAYLSLLTIPFEARQKLALSFGDLKESAGRSGDALMELALDADDHRIVAQIRTRDGYIVDPWVILVQAINHAADHRRQISGMMRSLGITPPDLDGWTFGQAMGALSPLSA